MGSVRASSEGSKLQASSHWLRPYKILLQFLQLLVVFRSAIIRSHRDVRKHQCAEERRRSWRPSGFHIMINSAPFREFSEEVVYRCCPVYLVPVVVILL